MIEIYIKNYFSLISRHELSYLLKLGCVDVRKYWSGAPSEKKRENEEE
jgi:hypothetical protein